MVYRISLLANIYVFNVLLVQDSSSENFVRNLVG